MKVLVSNKSEMNELVENGFLRWFIAFALPRTISSGSRSASGGRASLVGLAHGAAARHE